jgi:putative phosphotransacetylase
MEEYKMSKFLVETSARHVHLTEETFKVLFGEEATLTIKKELSQPGQYACEERVTVVGPKKALAGVSILGPYRKADQVEISMTDARSIGIAGVIRESGDLAGTPGCKLIGPAGEVEIKDGVIVAKRHIHATVADAKELGVSNGEIVNVKVETEGRTLIFGDVVVRVSDSYALAMHIDTDESNAASCGRVQYGEIVK